MNADLSSTIREIPTLSGVYIFFNQNKDIIYIGKAVNLKNRVSSYFRTNNSLNSAKRAMVREVCNIEIRPCDGEIEALILESNLIKKYNPKYNVLLKDDKSYAYLVWTKEDFPRIFVAHKTYIDNNSNKLNSLGPFVSGDALRKTLKILRKHFPYRSCKTMPKSPCIYYRLGKCDAPCIQNIDKITYKNNLNTIIEIMKGKSNAISKKLYIQMQSYAKLQKFEQALDVKNQIEALEKVSLHKGIIQTNKSYKLRYIEELQEFLKLDKLPKRIEGYDSSHFHGDKAVVSMVVFENGKPDKPQYRKFRIANPPEGGDDFYNLNQALTRRFKRNDWAIPDLILIDGGKGQLSTALKVKQRGNIEFRSIPIISLAKRLEEIYIPNIDKPILLSKSSKSLQILQQIRDESHRFAVTYHRKLRDKIER
ncbi:MAG: excinuclease ABC subunit UvrC [Candidatus Paceibacterota bacterium]